MTVQCVVWQTSINVSDKHGVSISWAEETLGDACGSKITPTTARTSILTQYY